MIAALTFTHPWVLLALCAPVLLAIWTWRRRGRNVVLPFDGTRQPRGRGLHMLLATAATMPQGTSASSQSRTASCCVCCFAQAATRPSTAARCFSRSAKVP